MNGTSPANPGMNSITDNPATVLAIHPCFVHKNMLRDTTHQVTHSPSHAGLLPPSKSTCRQISNMYGGEIWICISEHCATCAASKQKMLLASNRSEFSYQIVATCPHHSTKQQGDVNLPCVLQPAPSQTVA
jgi:hypothetical protein